jgi:hypothetical protein
MVDENSSLWADQQVFLRDKVKEIEIREAWSWFQEQSQNIMLERPNLEKEKWLSMSYEDLEVFMKEQFQKYLQQDTTEEKDIRTLCHVANYAMMLADLLRRKYEDRVYGRLEVHRLNDPDYL